MEKKALGKGLDAIIQENVTEKKGKAWATSIPVEKVSAFGLQPRKDFSEEEILELSNSIKEKGVLQPILVRRMDDGFELIAGERRLRASKMAGLKNIPAVVMDVSDEDALQISLIENLQRTDLTPVEEALAFKELQDKFNLSQQEIADRVSKDRSTVSNYLRLLSLPQKILDKINNGDITFGHAKALLGINDKNRQLSLCSKIISKGLSVREIENIIYKSSKEPVLPSSAKKQREPEIVDLEDKISKKLGTKVNIRKGKKRGSITIEFYSIKDLERIISKII